MTTVIITGASMGIGRALALEWGARRANLVLSARNSNALAEVAREVESKGGKAAVVVGDATDEGHRQDLIARAVRDFGGIDVLVNNAGRGFYAPALKIDLEELRALFELNVIAPLRLVQIAAPYLEASKGTIVMLSSVAGVVAAPRYAAYAASKFALEAISMSMRSELAEKDIKVCVIRPGPVDTPFRANATRAEGMVGYDAPDPKAQKVEDVAAIIVRAVERGSAVVETSAFVRLASAAQRVATPALRMVLKRMAQKEPS